MVINPEFAAASEIARILRFPSAIKIDTFANGTRYRNKQIGAGNSRLLLSGAGSAVTLDSHYIKTAYNVIDNFSVGVNNRDVIVLLVELLGKSLTNLAAAYYDNVHDLIAKKAGNCQTIARVRSPQYNIEAPFLKSLL